MNYLTLNFIDKERCKNLIEIARDNGESQVILVPRFTTNVKRRYPIAEQLQWDLEDLETELRCTLTVNENDNLVAEI